jgi:CubicO group peptidase (beta-lactamase class C family)
MLMTHSAGFQSATWPYKQDTNREPFEPTNWEQLVAVMPNQEIAFAPGSRFHYSNPAWIYLARVLESLTGDGWQDYIHKNVFAPLGMSRSYFGRTPHYLRSHRSRRYVVSDGADGKPATTDHDGDFDPGITIPNGGWNAPLADAAAYGAFLIGVTGDDAAIKSRYDAVLPRATLQEMLQPQLATTFSTSHGVQDIGLGFFLTSIGGQRIAGHSGHQGGFASFLHFNPAIGRAVVAAFNTDDATADADTRKSFTAVKEQALRVLADAS